MGIDGVIVLVPDLAEGKTAFSAILDAEGESHALDMPGGGAAHRFPVGAEGGQWLIVAEPDHEAGRGSDLASVPERYVQKYGAGPFAVCLTREEGDTSARPGSGALLDLDQLSGARFYL